MQTLHTFGCSITQGFGLADTLEPILKINGEEYTDQELEQLPLDAFSWRDVHRDRPSSLAWPSLLAARLGMQVQNHARRGLCFQRIARSCALAQHSIGPDDVVIVMWTYLNRLSVQWPARTALPFASQVDTSTWHTVRSGFNKLFGLTPARGPDSQEDRILSWLDHSTRWTWLDPKSIYNHLYNNTVLQLMTAGYLANTGARVIHLSVEAESCADQLSRAALELEPSLQANAPVPDLELLEVDHDCARLLFDPALDLARDLQHPGPQHHAQFAEAIEARYWPL